MTFQAIIGRLALASLAATALAGCAGVNRLVKVYSPCRDTAVTLYFESASDQPTESGEQVIAATAKHLRHCEVREVLLRGLADPVGSPDENLQLSKRRADHVLNALVAAGLSVPHFTLAASGDQGAVGTAGIVTPLRRRVDVTVLMAR